MDLKNVIISEFRKTLEKAQSKFAKDLGTTNENVQISLGLNADGSPKYILYKEYKPVRTLTINEVLGVKIDLLGKAQLVEMFLCKVLPKLSEQKQIPFDQLRVLCIQKAGKQFLYLANGSQLIGEIQLEDLISAEELIPQ